MKPQAVIAPVVLTALLVAGYFIDQSRSAEESLLSGSFENQPSLVASRIGGRVETIFAKEGDTVKKGQPLIRLENIALAETVRSQHVAAGQAEQEYMEQAKGPRPEDIAKQKAAVQAADADYRKLVNGPLPEDIRSARDKLAQAQAAYHKALAGPRKQEIDAARAADLAAEAKLKEAQNGLTSEERAELAARLDEAVAAAKLAKTKLDRFQILYDQDAISPEQLDEVRSDYEQAAGRQQDAQQAVKRAQEGTRPEEIAQAREEYRQAHAQLELELAGTRKEDIESATEDVRVADENLKLLLRGSRQEDIDAAKAKLEEEQQGLLELERGNRPEDVAKAREAHRVAMLQARSAQQNLKETVVYSPIDGQVDRVLVADGDLMAANASVLQLSNPTDIWIRVYMAEDQLQKVKPGDSAELAVDGISGQVEARVESVDTAGQFTPANLQAPEERGKQVFGMKLRLAKPDIRVKAGMYATVKKVGQWP